MRELRKIKKLSMYKALSIGYLRNEKRQARKLKKFGYILDRDLTNNERLVAYSPFTKKVIFIENGSESNIFKPQQFIEDWGNNLTAVTTGAFTYTPRFQDAKNTYLKAKKKYGEETPFKMVGHSQSAISINELAGPNDKGYTYNGALIKQKNNENVTNYRTKGDIVSALASKNDIITLPQPKPNENIIQAHNIENIKSLPVFV